MKGKKNDFSMTFYFRNVRVLFLEYVHNTDTAIRWVKNHRIAWDEAIIYNRRTREKIKKIFNTE